jgi:hypothetical protein
MMRLFIALAVWCALGAAAFYLASTNRDIASRQMSHRAFDAEVADVKSALADAHAAHYALVVEGQSVAVWGPRAAAAGEAAVAGLDGLRGMAISPEAVRALMEAAARLSELPAIERRAREYVASDQRLMASDMVFSAADGTVQDVLQLVGDAAAAEGERFEEDEAAAQRDQTVVGATAGAFIALAVGLLAFVGRRSPTSHLEDLRTLTAKDPKDLKTPRPQDLKSSNPLSLDLDFDEYARVVRPSNPQDPKSSGPQDLRSSGPQDLVVQLTRLCVSLDSVDSDETFRGLLGQAADLLDAAGLAVWIEDASTGALHAVAAHGYSAQALARMPAVTREADNAVAHAVQAQVLQVVAAPSTGGRGAIVAPLAWNGHAFGAITVELTDTRESSPAAQAITTLVASHLARILAPAPDVAETDRHAQSA